MRLRALRHRGMTLLELMLALLVVSVMGLAVATMTAAAGSAWTTRDHYRQQVSDARIIQHRIADLIRQSRRVIIAYDAGSGRYGDLLLWTDDTFMPDEVNLSELALITYDAQQDTLTLYEANLTAAQKGSISSNPSVDPTSLASQSLMAQFRSSTRAIAYPLATDVASCKILLGAGDPVPYRFVELRISLAGTPEGTSLTHVIAASVRAPDTAMDFGTGGGK